MESARGDPAIQDLERLELRGENMAEKQNVIICVVGRKGSGKSHLIKGAIAEARSRSWFFFIWDPMGEYSDVPRENTFTDTDDAEEFFDWSRKEPAWSEGWMARFISHFNMEDDFESVCDLVYRRGRLTFVVEEVPLLCEPGYAPPNFDRLIRLGRHRGVNLVCIGQRLAEFSRRLTAAADIFYIFGTKEPRDLQGIAERCGPEVAAAVAGLQGHDYVDYQVRDDSFKVITAAAGGEQGEAGDKSGDRSADARA